MPRLTAAASALLLAILAPAAESQGHPHPTGAPSDTLGAVSFATSCSPGVAPRFNLAVALLHSFEFGASIRGFTDVLASDSTCAMAHWGIAVSRWTNPMAAGNRAPSLLRQGRQSVEAGLLLGERASERERGYLRAAGQLYDNFEQVDQRTRMVNYERAMRDLARRYPDDTEATIFHALSLAASASPTDKTYANQLQAGQTLEALWQKYPSHPGLAHYIIHSYDHPPLADKARAAAQRYANIAPSAAHALHMPSHTFTRVGMWEESIRTNTRSREAALATGSIGEALHASDYEMYAYLQLGRHADARAVLRRLPDLSARYDPNLITGAAPGSAGMFALAAIPARYAMERRAWSEAAVLVPHASAWPYTEAMTWFARAVGAARTGNLPSARASIDTLGLIRQRLVDKGEPFWAEQVAIQHLAATAWLDFAEGRRTDAESRMREAAAREDAIEKNAVSPGPLAPAREMLADMLVMLGRTKEARAEYRATLLKDPNRRHSVLYSGGRVRR